MTSRLLIALVFATTLGANFSGQTAHVDPAPNPPKLIPLRLSVGGRTLQTSTSDARFGGLDYTYQWPGTYFEATFSGPEVYFATGKADEILHITIDHQPPVPLVKPAAGIYRVSGLSAGPHTVRVDVVTESQAGPDTFGGVAIPATEKAGDPPRRHRQIEFIGDSHTVGYGNTSPTRDCTEDQVWSSTDSSQSFAALVAQHYGADDQINAISGRGIVRNYNGSPGDPVPVAYPWILFGKKIYGDSNWHPQVIVIALGTNDFSTSLNPGEKWKTRDELHADYEMTYLRFLERLRATNPHAYFLIWGTRMANGEVESEESKVVDQWKALGESRVAFLPINNLEFTACNFHPSLADDRTIAADLEKSIDAVPAIWEGN